MRRFQQGTAAESFYFGRYLHRAQKFGIRTCYLRAYRPNLGPCFYKCPFNLDGGGKNINLAFLSPEENSTRPWGARPTWRSARQYYYYRIVVKIKAGASHATGASLVCSPRPNLAPNSNWLNVSPNAERLRRLRRRERV